MKTRTVFIFHFFIKKLFRRGILSFSVLADSHYANNNSKNSQSYHWDKNNLISCHFYSPLSKIVADIKRIITSIIPDTRINIFLPWGATNGPSTPIAQDSFAKSNNAFAKFSRCFLVNLILNSILSKIKTFVKICDEVSGANICQGVFRRIWSWHIQGYDGKV